jgi:hypothetical protein
MEEALPEALVPFVRESHRRTRLRNVVLLEALGRVLTDLGERGIRPIVLKGAVLADRFYPEFGTRSMSDVDLLVAKSELEEGVRVLDRHGFSMQEEQEDGVEFVDSTGVALDLHHRFRLFEREGRGSWCPGASRARRSACSSRPPWSRTSCSTWTVTGGSSGGP